MNTLRQARLNKGWTLEQAAKQFGVTGPHLSKVERNRAPGIALARKLASVYGLTLDEVFNG